MKNEVIPFLKWAGGKRWFTRKYSNLLPKEYKCYIEPFLGSGSVYFYMKPKKAILGDLNKDLVLTYNVIKNDWAELEKKLNYHEIRHTKSYYYEVRDSEPICKIEKAARLIYLNRTCFNGIYRVNLLGKFNVPIGTKNKVVYETDNFESISKMLKKSQIVNKDFEELINKAKSEDFIFVDPPYTTTHNENGFFKYNEKLFSWSDQERLAEVLSIAKKRNVKIIATNANHKSIVELYNKIDFKIKIVSRYSAISGKSSSRKKYEEIVIMANI